MAFRFIAVAVGILNGLAGVVIAQGNVSALPGSDKLILFADNAAVEAMKGGAIEWRTRPARVVQEASPGAPAATMPTILHDSDKTWKFYGQGDAGLVYAESADGFTWKTLADTLRVPPDAAPGFTPLQDTKPGTAADRKYKALGGSKQAGGLFALVSADGRIWRKLSAPPTIASDAPEAFYGRNGAFWSEAENAYVAFISEQRDGRRVISRVTSSDFLTWTKPVPLALNVEGEDIFSATVFPLDTVPPLTVGLFTRTSVGADGPADITLGTSRDAGASFRRLSADAWVRPPAGIKAWQSMVPSPAETFVRPERWFNYPEAMFYAGGRRYHMFQNRFVGAHAAFQPLIHFIERPNPATRQKVRQPAELTTKPFILTGTALDLDFSTDSTGSVKVEILDEQGKVIPGYSLDEMLGNYAGSRANEAYGGRMNTYMTQLYGDGADMRPFWGYIAPPTAPNTAVKPNLTAKWDIGDLKGKVIRLHIVFHGADVFGFRTPDLPRQPGTPYKIEGPRP